MRIAILGYDMPGYLRACLIALHGILADGLRYYYAGDGSSFWGGPENFRDTPVRPLSLDGSAKRDADIIMKELDRFGPDAFLVSGWNRLSAQLAAGRLKAKRVLTVCMTDTPWTGTFSQAAKCVVGKKILPRHYDVMWVPGKRAAKLAGMAGFGGRSLWRNLLTADSDTFSTGTRERIDNAKKTKVWPRRFIFIGRFSPEKNIEGLVRGYEIYRRNFPGPWDIWCVGEGPLRPLLENRVGMVLKGRRENADVARMMAECGCLVLPSNYEAWGVTAHEAGCAGLPLILSKNAGSCDELLRESCNGCAVDPRDPESIARAMVWLSGHPDPWKLGEVSYELSKKFSPRLWAEYLIERVDESLSEKKFYAAC